GRTSGCRRGPSAPRDVPPADPRLTSCAAHDSTTRTTERSPMTRLMIPVPLRWADLNAYGHVHNVAIQPLREEARTAASWAHPSADRSATALLDAGPGATTRTLVARQEVEYLLPLAYRREPVTVEMWIGHLGGASIEVCYEVCTQEAGQRTVYVRAATTL